MRQGGQLTILANFPVRDVSWARDETYVCRFFHTGWHQERGVDVEAALRRIGERRVELVHLQYQDFLYPPPFLKNLPRLIERVPLVVTFHDPGVPSDFPREMVSAAIFHTPLNAGLVGRYGWRRVGIIPMGIHDRPDVPRETARVRLGINSRHVLCSAGLGRTSYETVLPALSELVKEYQDLLYFIISPRERTVSLPDQIRALRLQHHVCLVDGFPPVDKLYEFLHAADIGLFYYPEFGVAGVTSAASRLGIASRRPVILTDVELTRDLPDQLKLPFGDLEQLKQRLRLLWEDDGCRSTVLRLQETLIQNYSWEQTAERHMSLYHQVLHDHTVGK